MPIDKQTNNPFFSIIVTLFNKEQYIKQCLQSILDQSFTNYEVLIINDGSTDNSLKITEKFVNDYKNFKVFNNSNHGLVWSREFALKKATGKYILYVDADDYISKNLLKICFSKIHINNDIDMICYGNFSVKNKKITKIPITKSSYYLSSEKEKEQWFEEFFLNWNNHINLFAGSSIIKKDLIKKHYCKDYRMQRGEDWAYSYECLYCCKKAIFLQECLYYYRKLQNSMNCRNEADFYNIYLQYDYWLKNLAKLNPKIWKRISRHVILELWNYIESVEKKPLKEIFKISMRFKLNNEINYKSIIKNIKDYDHLVFTDKLLLQLLGKNYYCLLLLIFRLKYGKK